MHRPIWAFGFYVIFHIATNILALLHNWDHPPLSPTCATARDKWMALNLFKHTFKFLILCVFFTDLCFFPLLRRLFK